MEGLEDPESYVERLSRWVRVSIRELGSVLCGQELVIKHMSRGPITVMHLWLQKYNDVTTAPMCDLVFYRCTQTTEKLVNVLRSPENVQQILAYCTDPAMEARCMSEFVANVALVATDFARRFTLTVRSYPHLLLWLVYRPPGVLCEALAHERSWAC